MIKRMIILLTIWLLPSLAFAGGAAIPNKGYGYSSGLEAGTAQLVKNSPGLIYDITLVSGSTTGVVTIYDANAAGPNLNATSTIWQVEASAANSTQTVSFANAPLSTTYGIELSTANQGVAYLNYQ